MLELSQKQEQKRQKENAQEQKKMTRGRVYTTRKEADKERRR